MNLIIPILKTKDNNLIHNLIKKELKFIGKEKEIIDNFLKVIDKSEGINLIK